MDKKCYFFGTFNPIHLGHIEIANKVKESMGFDEVILVPSYIPPHKNEDLAPYLARIEMARLAYCDTLVSDIESKLPIPSYTWRTALKLSEENNNSKINFIIGYDQFFKIESWKEPDILKEKLKFLVIPRKFTNGQTLSVRAFEYLKNKGFDFQILDIDFINISSSLIRQNVSKNIDITPYTTPEVIDYIEANRLYTKLSQTKFVG